MENIVVNKSGLLWSCDIKVVSECFFVQQKIKKEMNKNLNKARRGFLWSCDIKSEWFYRKYSSDGAVT